MKIQTIPIKPSSSAAGSKPGIFMFEVTGQPDPNNEVVQRARELLRESSVSSAVVEAFEQSVGDGRSESRK